MPLNGPLKQYNLKCCKKSSERYMYYPLMILNSWPSYKEQPSIKLVISKATSDAVIT